MGFPQRRDFLATIFLIFLKNSAAIMETDVAYPEIRQLCNLIG